MLWSGTAAGRGGVRTGCRATRPGGSGPTLVWGHVGTGGSLGCLQDIHLQLEGVGACGEAQPVWAAVLGHGGIPQQVLPCHPAWLPGRVLLLWPWRKVPPEQALRLPRAEISLFSKASSHLCRPCFLPCVANPPKMIRILFCFPGYLTNGLSS